MTGRKVADIPPKDMAEITAIAPLVNALPYFEAEIRKMQGQVIHATMALHEGRTAIARTAFLGQGHQRPLVIDGLASKRSEES